jgi:hypothetical protein
MKPVRTDKTNCILKGPEGSNVMDLPITRYTIPGGTPAVESCWKLSKRDLDMINKTGKLYFSIYGLTHPPIYIGVDSISGGE